MKNSSFSLAQDLLQSIDRLNKAISDEVDWFIVYLQEADEEKKKFYYSIHLSKEKKRIQIAKEEYERLK